MNKKTGWLSALALAGCAFSTHAANLPIQFINDTKKFTDDQIYVLATGKTPDVSARSCFIKLTNGNGVCTPVTATTKSSDFSVALSQIPNKTANMPMVQSGRIYLSIGHPVDMPLAMDSKTKQLTIVDPDGFKLRDPNYYVLYDKFEFSYVNQGLWVNPTAVDFFSLPISFNHPKGVGFKQVGLRIPQKEVIANVANVFNSAKEDPSAIWKKALFIEYPAGNVLRVISPGKAITIDPNSKLNPGHYFPNNYLMNPSGYNYTQKVWDFYDERTENRIAVDLSELDLYKPAIFTGYTKNNRFVFSNGTDTFSLGKPTSSGSFFGGAGGPFDARNKTPEAILVRQLTSAFEIGLLPRTGKTLLQFKDNLLGHKFSCAELKKKYPDWSASCTGDKEAFPYYQANANWNGTGPWYDLYSKALHSIHTEANPQPIYTFAYDDALGQDGTIHVPPADVGAGTLKVTLGDMTGVTIPEFERPGPYPTPVVLVAGAGNIVTYLDANGNKGKIVGGGPNGSATVSVAIPFKATFCDDSGTPQIANIYMEPAMVRPYVPGSDGIDMKAKDAERSNQPSIVFPGMPGGKICKNNE